MNLFEIIPIRALKDNYIWALLDNATHQTVIIDPGEALPVIETLKKNNYTLSGILITHHHWDHTNGIDELLHVTPKIPIIGSKKSPIKTITQAVTEGEKISIGNFHFSAFEIPGHTLDHTAYYHEQSALFTGDTLFSAGCGRIFEGTPEMMFATLNKIKNLPDKTQIYCGHEYTKDGLRFAEAVEPSNPEIEKKRHRLSSNCTLPSSLGEEKQFNVFLRCDQPSVKTAAESYVGRKLNTPLEVFTVIREWKNNFQL